MRANRTVRPASLGLFLYLVFCVVGGIFVADGTLHPARRPLTDEETAAIRQSAQALDADLADVSITTSDAVTLRAWTASCTGFRR